MNHNEWYKYAYVDYFSSFLKLWIAFNGWYEQNYIKEEIQQTKLKEWYQALKSQIIKPFDILKSKWIIDEVDGKIVLNNLHIQSKENFLNEFKEIIEEKALDFWSILVLDKLWDRKYVEKVWDDYNNGLNELMNDENICKNLFYFREKIEDLYENDKKINIKNDQESDINKYLRNVADYDNLKVNIIWWEFEILVNWRLKIFWDYFEDEEKSDDKIISEYVRKKLKIDWKEIVFFQDFELKTILLIIYFVRNKLVHWELNPSNQKHYEIIKLSFYIMDYIFKYLTKE